MLFAFKRWDLGFTRSIKEFFFLETTRYRIALSSLCLIFSFKNGRLALHSHWPKADVVDMQGLYKRPDAVFLELGKRHTNTFWGKAFGYWSLNL